jgi:hypothetical protein
MHVTFIVGGLAAALLGPGIYTGELSWFGRLPGDIRIEAEHARLHPRHVDAPLSVAGALLLTLIRRLF